MGLRSIRAQLLQWHGRRLRSEPERESVLMIQRILAFALRFKAITFCCTALLLLCGVFAFHELDIEAYPNPAPPLVITIVQPNGWSAEEVQRYVTVPVEVSFGGMRRLTAISLVRPP